MQHYVNNSALLIGEIVTCFHSSGHEKKVKVHMLDIMSFVVTEAPSISQSLLDVLLMSLLEKSQKMNPSAFEIASELLRRTASAIEQPLMTVIADFRFVKHSRFVRTTGKKMSVSICLFFVYLRV